MLLLSFIVGIRVGFIFSSRFIILLLFSWCLILVLQTRRREGRRAFSGTSSRDAPRVEQNPFENITVRAARFKLATQPPPIILLAKGRRDLLGFILRASRRRLREDERGQEHADDEHREVRTCGASELRASGPSRPHATVTPPPRAPPLERARASPRERRRRHPARATARTRLNPRPHRANAAKSHGLKSPRGRIRDLVRVRERSLRTASGGRVQSPNNLPHDVKILRSERLKQVAHCGHPAGPLSLSIEAVQHQHQNTRGGPSFPLV